MKIGILTFHRAHNYGAVLQCYALQEYLRSLGYDVQIIDYRQKWTEEVYKIFSIYIFLKAYPTIRRKIRYIYHIKDRFVPYRRAHNFFSSFRKEYLNISSRFSFSLFKSYDAVIVGSDQLWSMNCLGGSFDNIYLGFFDVKAGCKKIGYAISSVPDSIESLISKRKLNESVNNFDFISFREKIIVDNIRKNTGRNIQQCVDPTLLSNKHIWEKLLDKKWSTKNYIVCYFVRGRGELLLRDKVVTLANMLNCEVIDLSSNMYSVTDFISSIAFAKYVVTTSFHATVFSLIFKSPLASYKLNDGRDARYVDLLNKVGAADFIYNVSEAPKTHISINWDDIERNLLFYKSDSEKFLIKSLS